MNVTDIKTEAPPVKVKLRSGTIARTSDMLENIFARQEELEVKYGSIESANGYPPPPALEVDDVRWQRYFKDAVYRCIEELSEATNCLKNKPWKTTQVPTDEIHFIEEMMDALHFMVRAFLLMGLSAEDVYKWYFKKSEVNKFRQESKY